MPLLLWNFEMCVWLYVPFYVFFNLKIHVFTQMKAIIYTHTHTHTFPLSVLWLSGNHNWIWNTLSSISSDFFPLEVSISMYFCSIFCKIPLTLLPNLSKMLNFLFQESCFNFEARGYMIWFLEMIFSWKQLRILASNVWFSLWILLFFCHMDGLCFGCCVVGVTFCVPACFQFVCDPAVNVLCCGSGSA
jgi:hypothetical protein